MSCAKSTCLSFSAICYPADGNSTIVNVLLECFTLKNVMFRKWRRTRNESVVSNIFNENSVENKSWNDLVGSACNIFGSIVRFLNKIKLIKIYVK
jgi:hypothetical protein